MTFSEQQFELGRILWSTVLTAVPLHLHMADWMREIRPGDTVIEITAYHPPWDKKIGKLVREYMKTHFDEDTGKECGRDLCWTILTNSGEVDWDNARFVRIPATEHERALFKGYGNRCSFPDCTLCLLERWKIEPCRPPEQIFRGAL